MLFLLENAKISQISHFDISNNEITSDSFDVFLKKMNLKKIKHISIRNNKVQFLLRNRAFEKLFLDPICKNINYLDISQNEVNTYIMNRTLELLFLYKPNLRYFNMTSEIPEKKLFFARKKLRDIIITITLLRNL